MSKSKEGKTSPLEELNKVSNKLPVGVLEDINKRVSDWLSSGGKETDPYIEQQLRYANNVIEYKKLK